MTRTWKYRPTLRVCAMLGVRLLADVAPAQVAPLDDAAARHVLTSTRERLGRIRSLEYLSSYDSGRDTAGGKRDYVCCRVRVATSEHFSVERFHSDDSGSSNLDPELTLRIRDGERSHLVRPTYRTIETTEMRPGSRLRFHMEPYLAALAWWPTSENPVLVGDAPMSLLDALSIFTDWVVHPVAGGDRFLLSTSAGRTDFVVDARRDYAVATRIKHGEKETVRFDVEDFRQVDSVWLPTVVRQTVVDNRTGTLTFELLCTASRLAVNHIDENAITLPRLPGLVDLSEGEANPDRFRQIVGGGKELLRQTAARMRIVDGHTRGPGIWSWIAALVSGLSLGMLLPRGRHRTK